jgi:hypothetical protein
MEVRMSLLTRARRRTILLAAALALTVTGAVAAPASAGGIQPVTPKCYINPHICLSEYAYDQGFQSWSLTDALYTPYSYSIWNKTTGVRLALCGAGTTCRSYQVGYPGPHQCYQYVAYLGTPGGQLPLVTTVAASDVITLCR